MVQKLLANHDKTWMADHSQNSPHAGNNVVYPILHIDLPSLSIQIYIWIRTKNLPQCTEHLDFLQWTLSSRHSHPVAWLSVSRYERGSVCNARQYKTV